VKFDIQMAHSVEEVGQEAWEALSGDRPFAGYRWYRYGETVLADNWPLYITLSRQGEPVARGTFWLRRRAQFPISSRVIRRLTETIIRHWPMLVCRLPLIDAPGLILPQDPVVRDAALEIIIHAAQGQAQRQRASFLAWEYMEENEARHNGWPASSVAVQMSESRTQLDIAWPDYESYLGHLSKSTQKNYRRHCNRAADLGIEIRRHDMTTALDKTTLDRALELIRNVEAHHNSAPHPWARAMLKHAGMVNATWLKAEIEGQLVGCGLVLRDGHNRTMTLLGRDYTVKYVYFSLFYAAVHCAIENGGRVLWGGTGNYDFKQHMGFRMIPKHYSIFSSNSRLLQSLGRCIAASRGNSQG
jgi:predicted N-acyltransferase